MNPVTEEEERAGILRPRPWLSSRASFGIKTDESVDGDRRERATLSTRAGAISAAAAEPAFDVDDLACQPSLSGEMSQSSPTEAAIAAGFSDLAHLTRVFKRTFGITPAAFSQMQPLLAPEGWPA